MRKSYFLLLLLSAVFSACNFKRQEADIVLYNATVYTIDDQESVEQAIAIKDGKIVAVGKDRDILNNFRYSESIDCKKQFIYPGFIDAHCHFQGYAQMLDQVDLVGCKSYDELVSRVVEFAKQHPNKKVIQGRGWDHTDWPGKEWPNKSKLDELLPDVAVVLFRIDGHSLLVNQKAFDLAGVTPSTRIEGGIIEVKDGALTGVVKENANDVFTALAPAYSYPEELALYKKAEKNLIEMGLTALVDAGLSLKSITRLDSIYREADLQIFLNAMASDLPENFSYFAANKAINQDRFAVHGFKFYLDGSLGSRSACLKKDYHDNPGNKGVLTLTVSDFEEKLKRVKAMGFQAHTHAIGDSANRVALQSYAAALGGVNDLRWRIEHAQVVDSTDFMWFKNYSIIPSVQPTHATSDSKWAEDRLGQPRIRYAYAYKYLVEQLGIIALGTDFPVESPDPLATFVASVARKNMQLLPEGGFYPEQGLDRMQTLKGMTIWAALSVKWEDKLGSIEKGKYANLVVLDKDILKASEADLVKTKVAQTWVAGRLVYKR
ncbi:MAG TPA: amidohydrolase [Luteibaculaceae bacterium]|nr:amidohydrolase [Luteibaculaceae bacterium]